MSASTAKIEFSSFNAILYRVYGGRGCIREKQENISMLTITHFYACIACIG